VGRAGADVVTGVFGFEGLAEVAEDDLGEGVGKVGEEGVFLDFGGGVDVEKDVGTVAVVVADGFPWRELVVCPLSRLAAARWPGMRSGIIRPVCR
jgi:hypothetical protein